jgi:hypothetical protein
MKPQYHGERNEIDADRYNDEPRIAQQERAQALQDDARDGDPDRDAIHNILLEQEYDEGTLPSAGAYGGSLLEDCEAVAALGKHLGTIRMMPQPENLFDRARRLNKEANGDK